MIAVVLPEPAPWIAPLLEMLRPLGELAILAPWAIGDAAPSWLPARARGFWTRRILPSVSNGRWSTVLADGALRVWAGANVDRVMRARFWRREMIDRLAARWLPKTAKLVIAPSLSARRTFAVAHAREVKVPTILIEDLPSFRELHGDLDAAATRWPGCKFLRRYRASAAKIAAQEAERVLANLSLVRSRHAATSRERAGHQTAALPHARLAILPSVSMPRQRILLAGLASARNGIMEALAAMQALPDAELIVHVGEGAEPADLLARPRVRAALPVERETLANVDLVIAPAWCETDPPELARAAALGIPIVATARASGWLDIKTIAPGDPTALAAAIERALSDGKSAPIAIDHAATSRAIASLLRGKPARLPLVAS